MCAKYESRKSFFHSWKFIRRDLPFFSCQCTKVKKFHKQMAQKKFEMKNLKIENYAPLGRSKLNTVFHFTKINFGESYMSHVLKAHDGDESIFCTSSCHCFIFTMMERYIHVVCCQSHIIIIQLLHIQLGALSIFHPHEWEHRKGIVSVWKRKFFSYLSSSSQKYLLSEYHCDIYFWVCEYELLHICLNIWMTSLQCRATGRERERDEQGKKTFHHGRQFIPLIHEFQLELCDKKFESTTCNSVWSFLPKTHKHTQLVNISNSCMGIYHIVKQVSRKEHEYFGSENMREISWKSLIILQNAPPFFKVI